LGDCGYGRCCHLVSVSSLWSTDGPLHSHYGSDHRVVNRNAADVAPQPGALVHEYVQQHDVLGLLSRILLEGDGDSSELRSPIISMVLTFLSPGMVESSRTLRPLYDVPIQCMQAPNIRGICQCCTIRSRPQFKECWTMGYNLGAAHKEFEVAVCST